MLGAQPSYGVDAKVSTFASIVVGDILTGDATKEAGATPCPCFVADYGNGFMYSERRPLVLTESRVGAQLNVDINDRLSAVFQAVARGGNAKVSLEWAYLSYDAGANLTFQAGRKRIPIFYYSDFQDIGYAYIWVRPPGELYGWDMTNYNGASVRYRTNVGDLAVNSSIFGGDAEQNKDGYFNVYQTTSADVRWRDILGADTEVNYDWLTARAVYIQSHNQYSEPDAGIGWGDYGFNTGYETIQHIYGLALNADFGKLFALSEANLIVHQRGLVHFRSPAYSFGAGYRIGSWTPFLNYSDYTDSTDTPAIYVPSRFDNTSLTLRYDLAVGQDVKLQYNKLRDMSYGPSFGNSTLLSASYDVSL